MEILKLYRHPLTEWRGLYVLNKAGFLDSVWNSLSSYRYGRLTEITQNRDTENFCIYTSRREMEISASDATLVSRLPLEDDVKIKR